MEDKVIMHRKRTIFLLRRLADLFQFDIDNPQPDGKSFYSWLDIDGIWSIIHEEARKSYDLHGEKYEDPVDTELLYTKRENIFLKNEVGSLREKLKFALTINEDKKEKAD